MEIVAASHGDCELEMGTLAKKVFRKGSDVMLLTVRTVASPESDCPTCLSNPPKFLLKPQESMSLDVL